MENEQELDPELFARESQRETSETNASLSSGCSGCETSKCTTGNPKRRYVLSFAIKNKTFGGCFGSIYGMNH